MRVEHVVLPHHFKEPDRFQCFVQSQIDEHSAEAPTCQHGEQIGCPLPVDRQNNLGTGGIHG